MPDQMFHCPRLRASIGRQACYERQLRPRLLTTATLVSWIYDSPQDEYCRSGKCGLGCLHKQLFERKVLELKPTRFLQLLEDMKKREEAKNDARRIQRSKEDVPAVR